MNWATMSYLICHIHLTSCQLSLLQASQQLFAGKMFPQPASGRKSFQALIKSQSMDFYAIRINKLISCWQKCVDCHIVPILINKDVFEPSYNDLKFTDQNRITFAPILQESSRKTSIYALLTMTKPLTV